MMSRKPIFCVVLRDGELWQVEAEWPGGAIETIDKFKAHYEALHWVRNSLFGVDRGVYPDEPGCGIPMRKRAAQAVLPVSSIDESPGPNWIVDRENGPE